MLQVTLAQTAPQQDVLVLEDSRKRIENTLKLSVSERQYRKIKQITGNKLFVKNSRIEINNKDFVPEKVRTRGNNSLNFRRKSFSITLDRKATFKRSESKRTMKSFYAISLSMDKYYLRNRLAYGMMAEIGLFNLFYGYANLQINDNNEGIYLILEHPQDWAMKTKSSPLVIRRGYRHEISKIKTGKKITSQEKRGYVAQYKKIYTSLDKLHGEALYDTLTSLLDLELYMKWLAFNYFVRNGDYTDEVYFCLDPESKTYKFIPWDYDDIFAIQPHEGAESRKAALGNKLIFSSEDKLDRTIASDKILYARYLEVLQNVLETLEPKKLQALFENTFAELQPFLMNNEVIKMAAFDLYKEPSEAIIKKELNSLYIQLVLTRNSYLDFLDN